MSTRDSTIEIDLWETIDRSCLDEDIHIIPLDEVYRRFQTDPHRGLSSEFVVDARVQYGENKLMPPKQPSYVWLLFKELFRGFNWLLWLAAFLAFLAYRQSRYRYLSITNLGLGVVLLILITVISIFNVYQQLKSMKIVATFAKVLPRLTTVRRNGQVQQIIASELVPGDIILIRMGEKLPADCRFIRCDGLKINTSELTGKSKPISGTAKCTSRNLLESTNIGFYSTMIEQGTGEAVVIAIGDNTILGQMLTLTRGNSADQVTSLHREVNRFILFLILSTISAISILWITWKAWLNRKHRRFISFDENIINLIGMIVGFLPVAFPSAVTLLLAIVAKQMYRQRILVKRLQIVETFNSVSVIATDKTGTLTQNQMTVTHLLWDVDGIYKVPLTNLPDEVSQISIGAFRDLLFGAALCNNADQQTTSTTKSEVRVVVGDATDTALYRFCVDRCFVDINKVRRMNPRLKVLPFNSTNKFMITANQLESTDPSIPFEERIVLITLKGAPDIVIQRCSTYKMNNDQIQQLDQQIKENLRLRQEELGDKGDRVIGMCQQQLTIKQYQQLDDLPTNDFCFIGLFSLVDPPRSEVADAVLKARRAQIRVAMVTGDHPTTAKAIAKQVHILTDEISQINGIDTFKSENNNMLNLYRNGQLIRQHQSGEVQRTDSLSNNVKSLMRRALTMSNPKEADDYRSTIWYKRAWFSCRNQFLEPKTDVEPTEKKEYIPYAIVVEGAEINSMDDFMWDWVLSHQELVFARTSPEQKLRIVTEFQRRAEIVGVIGDGTNDAQALKCAHIGVAMQSGTEICKEASHIILLDNNFASIIQAIETGRLLSDNLKKVAVYLLSGGSWAQIWPVFFHLWLGMPLALSAFLATVSSMINDLFMSLALVAEKAEGDLMSRPPSIRSKDHLLNWKLLLHAYMFVGNFGCLTGFFCFCYYWIDNGVPFYSFVRTFEWFPYLYGFIHGMTFVAQSIYYCSVCLFQLMNYFATRTRYTSMISHNPFWDKEGRNWYVFGAMILSVGVQLLITKVAWFNRVFGTGPVPVKYVMPTLGFGALWILIDESRKFCIRKYPRGFAARIAW